jgi:hypothetical protein
MSQREAFAVGHDYSIVAQAIGSDVEKTTYRSRKPSDGFQVNKKHEIIPWGPDDNIFIETMLEKAQKSTIVPSTLEKIAASIYGGGIVAGKLSYDKKGNEIFTSVLDEGKDSIGGRIRRFFRDSNIDAYAYSAALNYVWTRNVRPYIALNKKDKGERGVASISNLNSQKVRWGKPKEGKPINTAFLHGDWVDGNLDKAVPVPVIEEGFNTKEKIRACEEDSFILKLNTPSILGCEYYHTPNWYSADVSNWLDVSLQIPKFKRFLMDNQMNIKYIVYIDLAYWARRYPDWDTKMTPEQKSSAKSLVRTEFVNALKGTEKGGAAVLAEMQVGMNGSNQKLWEIEELGKKSSADNQYIEDSQEASSHIMWALGADPAVVGAGPGKGQKSGGGSDKRVAANLEVSKLRWVQNLINKPLEYWRDTTDWVPDDIVFRYRNTIQLTLDQGKSQQETS